jgi:Protein of unknown function (DUF3047)
MPGVVTEVVLATAVAVVAAAAPAPLHLPPLMPPLMPPLTMPHTPSLLTPVTHGSAEPATATAHTNGWRVLTLPRQTKPITQFSAEVVDGRSALRVEATKSYGHLMHEMHNAIPHGRLSWSWRMQLPNANTDLHHRAGDDVAAKVCASFDMPLEQVPAPASASPSQPPLCVGSGAAKKNMMSCCPAPSAKGCATSCCATSVIPRPCGWMKVATWWPTSNAPLVMKPCKCRR